MYIYPDSEVKILRNVYLSNDYDHTIYFGSKTAQYNFFSNNLRVKYTLTNQQYKRKERGWIQVELNQNQLWDCTYLMFKNTHYTIAPSQTQGTSAKWFYAFILNVEYVNESVCKINYEIDVMQTWLVNDDYILEKCFVEREHTDNDDKFANLVEENLDIGNDLSVQITRRYDLNPDRAVVLYTSVVDDTTSPATLYPATARKIGDFFSGIGIMTFNLSDTSPSSQAGLEAFGEFLHKYIDNGFEDAIVSIYQIPHFISTLLVDPYNTETWTVTPSLVNVDGYVPKNKKLFNYPYNFLKLSNNKGQDVIFKHELWDDPDHIGAFCLRGVGVGVPSVMCFPLAYRDVPLDYENGLMYSGFNECAWTGDAYQVWLAQNRENNKLAMGLGLGGLLVGGALFAGGMAAGSLPMMVLSQAVPTAIGAGNLLGPAAGNVPNYVAVGGGSTDIGSSLAKVGGGTLLGSIFNQIYAKNKLEATPKPAHGHMNNDIFNMQNGIAGYSCYQMTIKREYAIIIDEYFSRFGYACHQIKVPNIHVRQNWTYTKTIGCEINGSLPSDDITKIKSIFDNGITFWSDGMNIGNYGDFTNPII